MPSPACSVTSFVSHGSCLVLTRPPLLLSSLPCDFRFVVTALPSRCTGCTAERKDQVPAHAPSAARAQEEVQDYLQGVASHDLLGLDSCSFAKRRKGSRMLPGGGGELEDMAGSASGIVLTSPLFFGCCTSKVELEVFRALFFFSPHRRYGD